MAALRVLQEQQVHRIVYTGARHINRQAASNCTLAFTHRVPFATTAVLNVAVGKAAMQSSTVGQGAPQRAIDGSTSTFYNPNTCTMTEPERNSWWYVNLLEPYLVQLVRIDFGTSCCCKYGVWPVVRGRYRTRLIATVERRRRHYATLLTRG